MEVLQAIGVFFFVLLLIAGAWLVLRDQLNAPESTESSESRSEYHYRKANALLTEAERRFFEVLEEAVAGSRYRVMCKVRLGDVVQVDYNAIREGLGQDAPPRGKGSANSVQTSARNQINQKHCDFVLLDRDTLEVQGVVELDDSSHAKASARKRDTVKDSALNSAGVKVFRQTVQQHYEVAAVRGLLTGGAVAAEA